MKRLFLFFVSFFALASTPVFAQTSQPSATADSVLFNRYLNNTFEKYYPIDLILKICVYLAVTPPSDSVKVSAQRFYRGSNYTDNCQSYWAGFASGCGDGPVLIGTDEGTGILRRLEDSKFPDNLRLPFQESLRHCMKEYYKKAQNRIS